MSDNTADDGKSTDSINYRDAETLRHLYWDEDLSTRDIADRAGVHKDTIRSWMGKLNVEIKSQKQAAADHCRVEYTNFHTTKEGYEVWSQWDSERGKVDQVSVHRLMAVAEYGFEDVAGNSVHHKDPEGRGRPGVPWDNRMENLEVLSKSDHALVHEPWKDSPIIP